MGSYSEVVFAGYPAFENKNTYFEEIVKLLFVPDDFVSVRRRNSTRNNLTWGDAYSEDNGSYTYKAYVQTAKVCRKRLEIYGQSYSRAKMDYANAKKIAKREEFYSFNLAKYSYDDYLKEIADIIKCKEKIYEQLFVTFRESLISGDLGIFGQTFSSHLYSILSVLPDDAIIEYDLTEIISSGWVKESDAKKSLQEKIIILAEGRTDTEFISKSIHKLYPYLSQYYHFLDFAEFKVETSASALVKLVRSFAAANVNHHVIAIFDNDTTGISEMKNALIQRLPDNIKVLKYPDISLAKKYPTLGPSGEKNMNINGFACSIELYFGKDVLTENGKFVPVQWKGFNEKENKFQGEITKKNFLQDLFRTKLKTVDAANYFEMEILLQSIFNAFTITKNKDLGTINRGK